MLNMAMASKKAPSAQLQKQDIKDSNISVYILFSSLMGEEVEHMN